MVAEQAREEYFTFLSYWLFVDRISDYHVRSSESHL